jgi:hypothetical protein
MVQTRTSAFPGVTRRERQMAQDIAMRLGLPAIVGTWFFVDGKDGDDDNNGRTPWQAVKLYDIAYGLCNTSEGDGICILSRATTSTSYSATITAGFTWSKCGITTFGVNARGFYNQRSRIAFTAATSDYYLFSITGHNNAFENVSFINQNDLSDAQITTVKLASDAVRNNFTNCDFKCSPATASAYKCDLWLAGAHENTFTHCNFGNASYAVGNNAACHIYFSGTTGNAQNLFQYCTSNAQIGGAYTAFGVVKSGAATAMNGVTTFRDCDFVCWTANAQLYNQASWFLGTGFTTGFIFVSRCGAGGYAEYDSNTANNCVIVSNGAATAAAGGIGISAK